MISYWNWEGVFPSQKCGSSATQRKLLNKFCVFNQISSTAVSKYIFNTLSFRRNSFSISKYKIFLQIRSLLLFDNRHIKHETFFPYYLENSCIKLAKKMTIWNDWRYFDAIFYIDEKLRILWNWSQLVNSNNCISEIKIVWLYYS